MFKLIPQPVKIFTDKSVTGFVLTDNTTVSAFDFSDDLIVFVKKVLHKEIKASNGDCLISLIIDDNFKYDEGYSLKCENNKVNIVSKTENGLFYGIQTLKQMLLQSGGNIPYTEIFDFPRFAYRGYMLDCGRYFYSVNDIKRIIELIALHKINILHWHLTEDQGWRIEIKKYPLLTEKGSVRSHTNFNRKSHGGFYTQEEIKEVVEYCHKHKIKVIPEFDVPGHNVAAIACYPYLSCFERSLEVATHWGVKRDILCAGKESTYGFVYDVLDEIMELFPDKIIHIGGDEAFKERWKICPHCQKAIKENNLHDENDLQMFFMSKVNDYLASKGYSSIMWGNDTEGGTDNLSSKIAWTIYKPHCNDEMIKKELERGRKLINSKNKTFYLDFPYGWTSLSDVCNSDGALTEKDEDTYGVEACMWTEYVPDMKKLEFMTFPRLGAIAENAWSPKNSSNFMDKVKDYCKLLDAYEVRYAPLNKANPSFIYKHFSSIWFKRRVFHWERIHIHFDNKKVKKLSENYDK